VSAPDPTRTGRTAPLLVLGAATLWGTAGTAQQLGPATINAPAVAALRSLFGGALLLMVVIGWLGGDRIAAVWRRARGPSLVAAGAMAAFQLGYFGGIRLTGVAIGTLVAIGSAPVTAGIIDAVRGRPPGARWVVATGITITGAVLLLAPTGGVSLAPLGIVAALIAGVSYATYTAASKVAIDTGVDSTGVMAVTFAGAAVLLSPALAFVDLRWAATGRGVAVLVWLSVMTIAAAYTLFALGLRHIDASRATTLTLAEPLTATLLAVLLLREPISAAGLVGAALMIVGLLLSGGGRRAVR
jgi:drug/metabolite transporter, DME family